MDSKTYQEILYEEHKTLIFSKKLTADVLHSSASTIDRLRKEGKLKSKKIGGRIFFSIKTIADYLCD